MRAFRKVSTYAMPHPGREVTRADEADYKAEKRQAPLHVSGVKTFVCLLYLPICWMNSILWYGASGIKT